jgi:type I restriction enzyme S subunit
LLYDYWFVQFEFPLTAAQATALGKPKHTGHPYQSSGGPMVHDQQLKRKIPKGWKLTAIADLVPIGKDTINPSANPEKLFKLFSIPGFDQTGTHRQEPGSAIGSNKFTVVGTDLLVSKLNPWTNRVIYPADEPDMVCSTEFVVMRPRELWMKNFLYMLATDPSFVAFCSQSATGTSNSHKRVNPSVMTSYCIPYSSDVARNFGETIHPMLSKRLVHQHQTQELTALRDWLLPLLMNGQVRVG